MYAEECLVVLLVGCMGTECPPLLDAANQGIPAAMDPLAATLPTALLIAPRNPTACSKSKHDP
jgi:hypothetical protein